ncbi:MAG TPA: hypothetical protein VN833_29290 [Candidatus Acidoferrales bacterium]|jgi:hypothetical protein|nr:hypothetical protein [Candidatus Acidoferrales bacterium]
MKRSYLTAALMFTCLLGVGISARAQDTDAVVVSVPFEFVAGGATLPAGEYRINRASPGVNRELAIRGYDKGGAFLFPLAFDEVTVADNEPTLSFEHVGGKYFLSKIKTLSGIYTMPASREMVMLGKANSPSPSTSSASGGQ